MTNSSISLHYSFVSSLVLMISSSLSCFLTTFQVCILVFVLRQGLIGLMVWLWLLMQSWLVQNSDITLAPVVCCLSLVITIGLMLLLFFLVYFHCFLSSSTLHSQVSRWNLIDLRLCQVILVHRRKYKEKTSQISKRKLHLSLKEILEEKHL